MWKERRRGGRKEHRGCEREDVKMFIEEDVVHMGFVDMFIEMRDFIVKICNLHFTTKIFHPPPFPSVLVLFFILVPRPLASSSPTSSTT